jgi:hypothetical protein
LFFELAAPEKLLKWKLPKTTFERESFLALTQFSIGQSAQFVTAYEGIIQFIVQLHDSEQFCNNRPKKHGV